jgi:hypothetical protein
MRLYRHLARGTLATSVLALAALVACSGTDRSSGVNGDGFKPPTVEGPCTPGTIRECGIELGRSGAGVVDCAKGTQTCAEDKSWTGCMANGTTFKAKAPPVSSASSPGLGTNAVGGTATTCSDNPCNPYCKTFDDLPDSGITTDSVTVISPGPTISLADSNVPGGFQSKGTLDAWCTDPAKAASACQFDMHCGKKADGTTGCIPFVTNEKNSCTGVDITAPPVCVPDEKSTYRNLTICNRGSADLTQNIQCMAYPGNSPQFPDDSPGAGRIVLETGSTVDPTTGKTYPIDATTPLKAGECRTYRVTNANFQSSGTESVMCNPPSTGGTRTTTLITYPLTAETTDFANPDFGKVDGDSNASATSQFTYTDGTTVTATGTANNTGFVNPSNVQGATDSAGASATLTSATSAYVKAGTVTSTTWSKTSASLVSDLDALDTNYATVSPNKSKTSGEVRLKIGGFPFPASITGPITKITFKLQTAFTQTDSPNNITGQLHLAKGGTILQSSAPFSFNSGAAGTTWTATLSPGEIDAADLPNVEIYADALTTNFAGSLSNPTMKVGFFEIAVDYYNPPYAQMDATGYAWATPPAGEYVGLDLTTTWRSSAASGSILYLYVKKASDSTTVATSAFTVPAGYTAGSWTTTTTRVSASGLTAADLTAGLKTTVQAYPYNGGSLDVDSISMKPVYIAGNNKRTIRFKSFGLTVPTGATNVTLTTWVNYKIDPALLGDWLSGAAYSDSAGVTTLISTSTAQNTAASPYPDATFRQYQLGAKAIADFASIEDPKLYVDIAAGKGPGVGTGTSTASVESMTMHLKYDASIASAVAECNPSNNWTVNKANPPTVCSPVSVTTYPPWTVTRMFDGACPVGSKTEWNLFGYGTATPAGTKVQFRFRATDRQSDGTCATQAAAIADPPAPVATAEKTATVDTQVCSFTSGTTGCPISLATKLGTDASKPCLQMDAYGIPTTTPAPAAPTLNEWRVTYNCKPNE